jgi:hypothetical protein
MLQIVWHLNVHDELFVDGFLRSKRVKFPRLPEKIQKVSINKLVDLLSKASEVIIRDRNQDLFR